MQEAFWWYERETEGLGYEFLRAVDACIASIERQRTSYPAVHQDTRRALLRRFPYGMLYLVEEHQIVVLACLHVRRDPETWQRRA
jgi:plasmid stabilization system protein ParE